jgi:uncharacterized membrane protein YgcG
MSRLTLLHINIIGVVVALIVGAALYFTLITGAQEAKDTAQKEYESVKAVADKLMQSRTALAKAKQDEKVANEQWLVSDRVYMPVMGYTQDRMTNMIRVFWPNRGRSWPERFRRTINNYMNRERRLRGIVWENPGVLVMGPYGPDPNTISPDGSGVGLEGPHHYTYQMRVRGRDLRSLLAHVRNWPSISQAGVPVVNGFTVSGNSPNLVADYTITFTVIVKDTVPPANNRLGGSQAGGGGGGGFGGGFGRGGGDLGGGIGPGGGPAPGMMRGPGGGGPPSGISAGGGMAPGGISGASPGGGNPGATGGSQE